MKPPLVDGTIERRRPAAYVHDGDLGALISSLPSGVSEALPERYPEPVTGQRF